VIADNASIDDTPAVGRGFAAPTPGEVAYVRIERKGRGYALKRTWSQSAADIVSYMDVDLSTGLEAFPPLIRAIAEGGYGVATGSRLARKSKVDRSLKRTALSRGYNLIIKVMTRSAMRSAASRRSAVRWHRRCCLLSRTTTGSLTQSS
jgi:glycosyltransferase involved in cell wall biosynthesis